MVANQEEEMDLNDWEFLLSPRKFDSGFIDHCHDDGDLVVVSPVPKTSMEDAFGTNFFLDMDYFICPSSSKPCVVEGASTPIQLIPAQIPSFPKESRKISTHSEVSVLGHETIESPPNIGIFYDRNALPHHVSFNKETEFVDMKLDMDSPKFPAVSVVTPQQVMGPFVSFDQSIDTTTSAESVLTIDESGVALENCKRDLEVSDVDSEKEASIEWAKQGNNQWWIGALCSFGVAATSICVLIIGAHHHHHHHHNHSINKRINKQVVDLKDGSISAALVRGAAQATTARISFASLCI